MGNKSKEENFKEQYYILREEERREEGRKFTILTLLASLIFIVILFGTVFLYFRTNYIVENLPELEARIENQTLMVLYNEGKDFKFEGAKDVESDKRTITIKNDGSKGINYKIAWVNVFNDLSNPENLVMTIKRREDILVDKKRLPANAEEVLSEINISGGTEHEYEIIIEHINTEQGNRSGRFEGQLIIEIQR